MHTLEPSEHTLHGYFSRDLPPVLTIQPGETVRCRTLDSGWNAYDPQTQALVQSPLIGNDALAGHALCGPIAIAGAKAGMVLEVEVGDVVVAPMGWNRGGGEPRPYWERLGVANGPLHQLVWHLDANAGTATSDNGFRVGLAPFMGVMGMPPPDPGQHTTRPPRIYGGNIDCKLLVAGSKLYLPVPVDGGLFSVGDGHAVQADGEASIYAIECPIDRVDLTFRLHKGVPLATPRAETPAGWVTFGFDEDLNEAMLIALNAMLDWMMDLYTISRKDALALASLAVDLHITQVVNTVQGVHALLPPKRITRAEL